LICLSMCAGMLLSAETLTLEECVDIARSNNPSIQQTELNAEIGKSKVRQAYSAVMPNLSVSSGLSTSSQTSWDLGTSMGINAGMTFYAPGMYSGIKSAKMSGTANCLNSLGNENNIVSWDWDLDNDGDYDDATGQTCAFTWPDNDNYLQVGRLPG